MAEVQFVTFYKLIKIMQADIVSALMPFLYKLAKRQRQLYQTRQRMKLRKDNCYVITGGPGVGKTTLLNELAKHKLKIVPENAREIIKQEQPIMEMDFLGKTKHIMPL